MAVARRRCHHIAGHRFRSAPVERGPVAQLTIAVMAPGQQLRGSHRHRDRLAEAQTIRVGHRHIIDPRVRHGCAGQGQQAVGRPQDHGPVLEPLVSQRLGACGRNTQIHRPAHRHLLAHRLGRDGRCQHRQGSCGAGRAVVDAGDNDRVTAGVTIGGTGDRVAGLGGADKVDAVELPLIRQWRYIAGDDREGDGAAPHHCPAYGRARDHRRLRHTDYQGMLGTMARGHRGQGHARQYRHRLVPLHRSSVA